MPPDLLCCFSDLFTPPVLRVLIAGLHHTFSGLDEGQVEDAVMGAALDLLRSPRALPNAWRRGGPAQLRQVLVVAAWRGCLKRARRGSARYEVSMELPPEPAGCESPENLLISEQTLSQLDALVAEAARRFGGDDAPALAGALTERLGSTETDGEIARRHRVRRESLNRAKNWLAARLVRA